MEVTDAPAPATGFAFEVENVLWALSDAGVSLKENLPLRVLVAGGTPARRRNAATHWRATGARTATVPAKNADEAKRYAAGWDYDLLVWQHGSTSRLTRLRDGRSRSLETEPDLGVVAWARDGNA